MLHLLPEIERIAVNEPHSPNVLAELGSAGSRLQKLIREDVYKIIHEECVALHMKLEERLYLMETNQRTTLQTFLGVVKSPDGVTIRPPDGVNMGLTKFEVEKGHESDDGAFSQSSTTRSNKEGRGATLGLFQNLHSVPNALQQATLPSRSPEIPDVLDEPMTEPPHDAKLSKSHSAMTHATTTEWNSFKQKAERMQERKNGGLELAEASGWGKKIEDDSERESLFQKGVDCCHFTRRQQLLNFIKGPYFEGISSSVIFLNAIFMGIKANIELNAAADEEVANNTVLSVIEKLFTAFFAVEWLMRFMVYQKWFFRVEDWKWHVFDTVLVGISVIEVILEAANQTIAGGMDTLVVRLFRMVRLVRLLKIVRYVSAFRELRLMINGLLGSMRSLFWSFVLLASVIYIFSICFTQAAIVFLQQDDIAEDQKETRDEWVEWFGSTQRSMRTLLISISGGADWAQFVVMLESVDVLYSLIFIFYIMLVFHGVLHVIASIFVECSMATSNKEKDHLIRGEMQQKDSYMTLIRAVLLEADHDESGTINWLEFQRYLEDPRMRDFFKAIELDVTEARGLFKLLDMDESDEVPIDEFVTGCFRLKGGTKALDLTSLMHENKRLMRVFMRFMGYTQTQFEALFMKLDEVGDSRARRGLQLQ
mmetsp:Transcript_5782/g.11054  ORF Transcript_5782/g.11054 Transcript_5782/m.11054 type:complete len:651 (-) Transcript_5782:243-2195(-)